MVLVVRGLLDESIGLAHKFRDELGLKTVVSRSLERLDLVTSLKAPPDPIPVISPLASGCLIPPHSLHLSSYPQTRFLPERFAR